MELKSTLKVYNESDLEAGPGVVKGQTQKLLIGTDERPGERLRVILASFESGTHEHLHWHLIEAFYYVMSGTAVMTDIEGRQYDIGPGSVIYAPPGIAGSHSWEIKERLQLIAVRATTDPERTIQFTVDKSSKESKIEFDYLISREGAKFKKSLY